MFVTTNCRTNLVSQRPGIRSTSALCWRPARRDGRRRRSAARPQIRLGGSPAGNPRPVATANVTYVDTTFSRSNVLTAGRLVLGSPNYCDLGNTYARRQGAVFRRLGNLPL